MKKTIYRFKKPRRLLFICLCSLILLWGYDIVSFNQDTSSVTSHPTTQTVTSRTPLAKNVQLAWPATGEAALGSVEDGLLSHSSDTQELRPTASMAKVIAALAIMKQQPLKPGESGPLYTITAKDVANYQAYAAAGGSVVPVYQGMQLTQYQALQAMLIPSANNIARLLVERVFGSESTYISYAQKMLQQMGINRTTIADASGFSSATKSTPSDLVKVGIAALKNPVIAEVVAQPQAQLPGIGMIKNTNELLGTNGVVGIKTGTTNSAGSCLLFAADYIDKNEQKVTIVGVIMGDTNATTLFNDSANLLASAQQSYGLETASTADNTTAPVQHLGSAGR